MSSLKKTYLYIRNHFKPSTQSQILLLFETTAVLRMPFTHTSSGQDFTQHDIDQSSADKGGTFPLCVFIYILPVNGWTTSDDVHSIRPCWLIFVPLCWLLASGIQTVTKPPKLSQDPTELHPKTTKSGVGLTPTFPQYVCATQGDPADILQQLGKPA